MPSPQPQGRGKNNTRAGPFSSTHCGLSKAERLKVPTFGPSNRIGEPTEPGSQATRSGQRTSDQALQTTDTEKQYLELSAARHHGTGAGNPSIHNHQKDKRRRILRFNHGLAEGMKMAYFGKDYYTRENAIAKVTRGRSHPPSRSVEQLCSR